MHPLPFSGDGLHGRSGGRHFNAPEILGFFAMHVLQDFHVCRSLKGRGILDVEAEPLHARGV